MKAVLAVVLLVGITTFAMAAGEKITMTYDLGAENPKWKFAAGQWVRRASGGRQVLAQTAATQPWAVAVLEDQKFEDVDVSVRFRPVSGKEDASGGIIFRAKDGRNYFLVRANALENNFRLYAIVNGKRSTIASARVEEPKLGTGHKIRVGGAGTRGSAGTATGRCVRAAGAAGQALRLSDDRRRRQLPAVGSSGRGTTPCDRPSDQRRGQDGAGRAGRRRRRVHRGRQEGLHGEL